MLQLERPSRLLIASHERLTIENHRQNKGTLFCPAEETNQGANATAPDDYGYDFREGKTNKIARVYSVTPIHVQVIYEGGQGGRNIPRQSLPPALQAKYPYDAEKAAEYQRQQAEAAAHQVAAQQAAYRVASQHRETGIKAEIERLELQDRKLEGAINLYDSMAKGNGRKKHLADLRNERQHLRERKLKLQEQLQTMQSRRDSTP